MQYPCTRTSGRRFHNVFTVLSPGGNYFQGLLELAHAKVRCSFLNWILQPFESDDVAGVETRPCV
jgi:hypothetical protein